ncbi:hypothetical protein N9164_16865 [Draconibacterium sp.]|nr:hypothetical protein [Draconibacterium sp.]
MDCNQTYIDEPSCDCDASANQMTEQRVKEIAIVLTIFTLCRLGFWLGGVDLDERSIGAGFSYFVSAVPSAVVWFVRNA